MLYIRIKFLLLILVLFFQFNAISQCSVSAGNDTTVCQGQPIIRIATYVTQTAATIQWYLDGNPSSTLSSTTTLNITPSASGIFYYIIKVNSGSGATLCTVTDTIKVTVNPRPRINAGSNQSACQKTNESITATYSPSNGNINWYLLGSNTSLQAGAAFTLPTLVVGTFDYIVKIDSLGVCSANDTVKVIVNPKPKANFTFTSNCGRKFSFTSTSTTATGTITDYCWNFGTGQTGCQSDISDPYFNFPKNSSGQTYNVRLIVTNSFGCKDTISQAFTIGEFPIAELANASPTQQTTIINGEQYFYICSSGSQQLQFLNNSQYYLSSTTYQIKWGDASSIQNYNQTTFPAAISTGVIIGNN